MTATAETPVQAQATARAQGATHRPLGRGDGVELLGDIHGCGYRNGACLVRRSDGQMVQLGPLMYGLLECIDGERDVSELADELSGRLGRRVESGHVARLAQKLSQQGLLAGTEQKAPPRRNPLLALRWKVLVTNPKTTGRLTAPFAVFFRPWLMWPIIACFAGVFWFVLIQKGVASATEQAFRDPGLFLLVFALGVLSAGFHELGHAAAARYGGATPGGMGMGLYLVWPAFYTDVTDAYRLPRRDRLRIDLAGLYFNAAVAVATMALWLVWRVDALLLLVALQILQMIKQLSPVIRADGYHILADATGVPDLYAHMGPTLRRLLPGHRHEPSALNRRARILVTLWVLIIVPVLLSLMLGAVLMLPRLATTAWESGRHIALTIPHHADDGQILDVVASAVSLAALILPVLGSVLVTQRIVRTVVRRGRDWSQGHPARRAIALIAAVAATGGIAWAWWPSGQYQPIRARHGGTLAGLLKLVASPFATARPSAQPAVVQLPPGTHLAIAMIPVGGATKKEPAFFVIPGTKGKGAVAVLSGSAPRPYGASDTGTSATSLPSGTGPARLAPGSGTASGPGTDQPTPTSSTPVASQSAHTVRATAFPFRLPSSPGHGNTQALAVNTTNGRVTYDIAYALITVRNGAPVDQTNSAFAIADCKGCTTVAVSFQIVLVIGQSKDIAPIDAAGALNYQCPACSTTAIADQIVVTLNAQPTGQLLTALQDDLKRLNELPALGAAGTPAAIAAQVAAVQQQIATQLDNSGVLASSLTTNTSTTASSSTSTTQSTPSSSSYPGSQTSTGNSAGSTPALGSTSSGSPSTTSSAVGASSTSTTTSATGASTTTTAPTSTSAGATQQTQTTSSSGQG